MITVNEHFWECLKAPHRYVHSYGGRGSGKSRQEAIGFVLDIVSPEYFRGVMVREVSDTIRHSQFAEIKAVIEASGLSERIEVNETRMEFHCPSTGNSIISRGLKQSSKKDTARFKSIVNPTKVWIEEAEEISEGDFDKIDGSVRKKNAKCQIRMTYNTSIPPDHWIRKRCHEPQREDTFYLHSTYRVNIENLDVQYIISREQLAASNPERYAVEVEGQWGVHQVIRPFATQYDHIKHRGFTSLQPHRTLYISFDFNLDPFAVIFGHVWEDRNGFHFHIFDELSIKGGSLDEAARQIKAKYGHLSHNMHITGDFSGTARSMQSPDNASNFKTIQRLLRLRDGQLEVRPNPRHSNSRTDCNFLLANIEDFTVSDKCLNLDRDLRTVEVDANEGIIKADRKNIGQRADHLDAWRYMVNIKVIQEWITRKQKR